MGTLAYKNKAFIYAEDGKERVMLNCGDYIRNKSRVPMHNAEGQESYNIFTLISGLMDTGPCSEKEGGFDAALIDILLAARLIRTSQPVRVLEYGCTGGDFSWYLASVVGAFCEKSTLVCASDRMDPEWMERIAQAKSLPKISFMAGDYGCLQLPENYFDVVLINGRVNFAEPCKVISDASRLAADDGLLLCYADHMPLLESAFRLFYDKNEDYEVAPAVRLMSAEAKNRSWTDWGEAVEDDLDRRAKLHLTRADDILLKAETDRGQMERLLEELKQDCVTAAKFGKVDLKIQLVEQKGRLLDYALRCFSRGGALAPLSR